MNLLFKNYLRDWLKFLAIKTIIKYQPGIVAITGTVGKTSTKEAVYAVLRQWRRVRASRGNFNNEIGLPLTILGDWTEIKGLFFWPRVLAISLKNLVFKVGYPEILVLEYGADRPGDIRYLLDIARPQIGLVTALGDIPVHVEFYTGPEAVAREKSRVIESLPVAGFAILNFDDEAVLNMQEKTRAHIITFGFGKNAEVRISNFEVRNEELPAGGSRPVGVSFKLEHNGSFVPIRLNGAFGKAQAYAAAAAAAAGLAFGLNLVRVAEALQYYQPPPHRMTLLPGVKGTFIIDDTYNASPLSTQAALETVSDLPARRKIAVLGDMLELGQYSAGAHQAIGQLSFGVFDILVTVGLRAKFIADAAIKSGFERKNVLSFDTADQARLEVQALLERGDLVLIKGSRAMELEKIVREIQLVISNSR